MANPSNRLSAAFVRTVSEPGKYHDGGGIGLLLRVDPSGAKFWIQRTTIRGKRREMGLGSFPLVSLAEARDAALENKRAARAGRDPLQEKRKAAAVLTFEEAGRKVHEIHKPSWKNAKHAAQFISTLEKYAFPKIGNRNVSEVDSADILKVLQPIWLEKPETARRVRQRIGTIMKWAVAQGWRQDNPAQDIGQALPKQDARQNHRKALHYSDVARCLEAVDASGAWQATKLAIRFLVLTAARSGEVRMATWDEIDLGKAVWKIPAERMKAKRPHRVPLSPEALGVLNAADKLKGKSGLVFPSARDKPLSDMTLSKLVKELGFDADIHGFRTSFRTWTQERTNLPREVAEAALAHTIKDKAEAAYARSDLFEKRRDAMARWAKVISESGGEVVRLG